MPPETRPGWSRNPVDHFIIARLEQERLAPSPDADRATLVRRLYFDLLGLPPTPEDVAAFCGDDRPGAYERLVDRLLASPHFGERWARHWLDVVRFAESHGFEMNQVRPNAWPYRDYAIRAFNADKPYDQFVCEQIAGDAFGVDEATGFLVGGAWDQVKSPDPVLTAQQRADELHDMVSTTGSAFLGLTVGCARCHDHKFDPVSQTEYYAIKAVFAGVQHGERALRPADYDERTRRAADVRCELTRVERRLEQFEPIAHRGRTVLIRPDDTARVTQLPPFGPPTVLPAGESRGQADDRGDADRLPNVGAGYLYWKTTAQRVCTWSPQVAGRFRVWLSWGCGWTTHATDARFLLDRDGDLTTQSDQTEIARVNQQNFADGTCEAPNQPLWSGFYDAGVHELDAGSKLVLRGGDTEAFVTADVICLQEGDSSQLPAGPHPSPTRKRGSSPAASALSLRASAAEIHRDDAVAGDGDLAAPARSNRPRQPHLRLPVTRGMNVDRFAPIEAKFVRFTITATTQLEPCIDELEVLTAGTEPRNVALASLGTKAIASSTLPGYDIHKLEHVNDGQYGNSRSWISNERGAGWVQLEFSQPVVIDRVVWSRDREDVPRYNDRLAVGYRIEVAFAPGQWRLVASSDDRLPQGTKVPGGAIYSANALMSDSAAESPLSPRGRGAGGEGLARADPSPWPSPPGGEGADPRRSQTGKHQSPPTACTLLKQFLTERDQLRATLRELETVPMSYAGKFAAPEATPRLHRGDPTQPRETIAPGALARFGPRIQIAEDASEPERRLAFARWLTDPENPLPARVIVNRIWQQHFGEGLVSTPSDFGRNGAQPTHPELLDWLASELVASGWSLKAVHRLIVLSSAYRQSSATSAEGLAKDAAGRLLWRYPPRRLEAEPLRDAILAVSGNLDRRMGGPGFDLFEPNTNYVKVYSSKKQFGPDEWRRMIYQSKPRMQLDDTFGAFDCPDAGQIAPKRTRSTTPLQALNLLNGSFVVQQAGLFAERLQREAGADPAAQARRGFQLAFQREPSAEELTSAEKLIREEGLLVFCRSLFNANEFLAIF